MMSMPMTAEEIRELINQKTQEIIAQAPRVCRDCGDEILDGSASCAVCDKAAALQQLRHLASVDPNYASVLAQVEAAENE